jgi:hypothetical protein
MNLNQELIKQGWSWWYPKYAPGDTVLEGLEKEAQEARWAYGPMLTPYYRGRCAGYHNSLIRLCRVHVSHT